jgi:galactitol-specific phosphotransferase system IIB component
VASVIIRASSSEVDNEEGLAAAAGQMETMKGKKSSVTGTLAGSRSGNGSTNGATNGSTDGDTATATPETGSEDDFDYAQVNKIIFACDAGMGSSAMGASLLKNKAKKAGLTDIEVKNTAINQIPGDADVVITHKDLTDRARNKLPGAQHVSVDNFLGSPKYDELIDEISDVARVGGRGGNRAWRDGAHDPRDTADRSPVAPPGGAHRRRPRRPARRERPDRAPRPATCGRVPRLLRPHAREAGGEGDQRRGAASARERALEASGRCAPRRSRRRSAGSPSSGCCSGRTSL